MVNQGSRICMTFEGSISTLITRAMTLRNRILPRGRITAMALRITQVVLMCNPGGKDELAVFGEIEAPTPTYRYYLSSPSSCYKTEGSLSAGSVLLIVFTCLLVTYLIVGISYQKLVRKSTGKDLCPNYNLWSTIPGCIKDGFIFVVNKLKGLTTKQYQPVK
ncbi:hypothetical protein CHS0354_020506 [Potamilus streckersoni]|uniref:Cation-dependent mannose-6-phosphate receptor n=1 Tax=Potamilus streckersoni TaxID=2493646 RepID=A0AAE0W4J3_9BIVA|nr:hypothetical protein CHS0354_020506 [Potamilus streckersoni]